MDGQAAGSPLIDWGIATLPLPGQSESGDGYVVMPFPNGALVGVVDGLGHGPEAATAARIAVDTLAEHADESVLSLISRCHERLKRTRGAVMSLASLRLPGEMTWLGVGNVEAILLRAADGEKPGREAVLSRGGVVGYQLPPLRSSIVHLKPGDLLIFATDGIRSNFVQDLTLTDPPQTMADRILSRSGRGTDDALVLVARYLGGSP